MFKDKTILIGFILLVIAIIAMLVIKFVVLDKTSAPKAPVIIPTSIETSYEKEAEIMNERRKPYESGVSNQEIENVFGGKPKFDKELIEGF